MRNKIKSKEQFEELQELHHRAVELEKLEIKRKWIEFELQKNEEKYRHWFEKAKDNVVMIQDQQIKYASPGMAELIGYTLEEINDTLFARYVHPDELPKLSKYYLQRKKGEHTPIIYHSVVRHKNGSNVYIKIKASIITYHQRPATFAIVREIPS